MENSTINTHATVEQTIASITDARKWVLPIPYLRANDLYNFDLPITEYFSTTECEIEGKGRLTIFGGYSYLSLHRHPHIQQAVAKALNQYGTGGHGARALAGTTFIHKELERRIATFKNAEDAITFSSGYICNISTIASLVRQGDTILTDQLNHASIIDGCKLSGAKLRIFRHNDMTHLDSLLKESNTGNVLVVADGVFSMNGDIFNLPVATELCKKYGAVLMIDECHSMGIIGKTGRGIEEHFGLPSNAVDVKMGTFSKVIPSQGGYVAGTKKIIDYLRHNTRGLLMSGANAPTADAASIAALDIIEQEPERVQRLHNNTLYTKFKLKEAGIETLVSDTAIIPIWCGEERIAFRMTDYCIKHGIYIQAVTFPVVPQKKSILRLAINTDHTKQQIDRMVEVLKLANQQIS